jgi:hypothetical protein
MTIADFFPIRAVTLLEVFCRAWIAALIDHGSPFAQRAGDLSRDLKFDLNLINAMQGRVITLGDIIAHNVPINSFAQICSIFTILLGNDLIHTIKDATTIGYACRYVKGYMETRFN